MLRVGAELGSVVVTTDTAGIEHVALDDLSLPVDRRGAAFPHFTPSLNERYLPAASVLDRGFDTSVLRDAIVLLGVTGLGLGDIVTTPLGPMSGVEIHAQLIENILLDALLRRPGWLAWLEVALVAVAGLAIVFLPPYERPLAAAAVVGAIVLVPLAAGFAAFRLASWQVDALAPAIAGLMVLGAMMHGNLHAAQTGRRRLAHELERERELKARLDGELAAARSIQMGLLPRRFPAFPDRPDIDLCARIEPARMVGGDLFDFLLIDRDRLFFAIADVSGKGMPAALFMAMTKEVLRDAVLRHGTALDRVLAAANATIAASAADLASEGGDMMFVTAFAGILDLATGELAFASAGHDAPFVLSAQRPPRQLATEGGPPLGCIDDFAYPVDRDRLEPGAVLLLYTDGVTEAENADHARYSGRRLAELLAKTPPASAAAVVDGVVASLTRFVGAAEPADDVTLLALRRSVSGSGVRALSAP
jgi:serine phosphatase RsbU (regulator of sigma subunit)